MKIKTARNVRYPYQSDGVIVGLSQTGTPAKPQVWLDGTLQFQWEIQVPVTAAGVTSNFAAAYPSEEFDFGGKHWVRLLWWDTGLDATYPRQALLLVDAWLSWGNSVVSPLTLDAAQLTARLSPFANDLASNDDDDRFEAVTVVSAGGLGAARFTPKSTTQTAILNGETGSFDRNKLALQIENTGGSAFVAGPIKLTVLAREI